MNTTLIHDLITRQIDLMRYEVSVRKNIFSLLDTLHNDVAARLVSGSLKTQLNHVERIVSQGYQAVLRALDVLPVLDTEAAWLAAWLGGLVAAYGLKDKIVPLGKKAVRTLADAFTLGGFTLQEAIAKQSRDLGMKIKAWLRVAHIDGTPPDFDELGGFFMRAKQTAQAMTRTWITAAAHAAHEAFARVNPLIKGYRHLSVLDGRTTSLCTHRHGLLWDKRHNPIGHKQPFKRPPLHINCRSKLVYVYDLQEPFDGYSGADWVKSRSLHELQDQFGKNIGQMLHEGRIGLEDTLDGLKPLTLEQLQDKLGIPETIRAIERRSWTDTFKEKSAALYYQFEQAGFILDIHAVSRLSRLEQKGFADIDAGQVLDLLKSQPPNFYQPDNGRLVYFSEKMQIAVIQSADNNNIITLIRMKKAKAEWKTLPKS